MGEDDLPTTEELRAVQVERVQDERDRAGEARQEGDDRAERAHDRRAERAGYLAEKLDKQAEALDE